MKQETKFDIVAAIMLFSILLAMFSLGPMIPETSIWIGLYCVVLVTLASALGLIMSRPLTALIGKFWK
jgi:hypothetical protein